MRRLVPLLLVVVVVAAFVIGGAVRDGMAIEYSPESIRGFVEGLGWRGPAIFLAMVTFRNFLLLPSGLLLVVGGLAFGALGGTLLGSAGVVASALMKFFLARGVGGAWLQARLGPGLMGVRQRVERAGPLLIGLATAHPMGPMSPLHWASGFSSMPFAGFLLAVLLGAPLRAAAYSLFGATLLEVGTPRFYLAALLLAAVVLAPLAFPGVRRRLFRRRAEPAPGHEGPTS